MNRQRLLLAILAVLLVLSLIYAFWATPRQEQAPMRAAAPAPKPATRDGQAATKAGKATGPKAVTRQQVGSGRLQLELLEGDQQPFPGSGRDIFRFNTSWSPVPEVVVRPVAEEPPPPPPPPPPTPEELLNRDLAAYKVTGLLEKRGVRSLFVTDGKEILVIKAGERFGPRNRFLARDITATELVVSEADNPTIAVRLPLGDTHSAEPAVISPVSVARPEVPSEPSPESPAEQLGRRLRSRSAAGAAAGGAPPEGTLPAALEGQMQPSSGEPE